MDLWICMLFLFLEPRPDTESFEEYTCVGWGMREGRRKVIELYLLFKGFVHPPTCPTFQILIFFQVPVQCHFSVMTLLIHRIFSPKVRDSSPCCGPWLIKLNVICLHNSSISPIVLEGKDHTWIPMLPTSTVVLASERVLWKQSEGTLFQWHVCVSVVPLDRLQVLWGHGSRLSDSPL